MTPQERAELAYLLERVPLTGGFHAGDGKRWWGRSSNAMVAYAFGGHFPDESHYPRDRSDYAACVRAVRRAPRHMRPKMVPVLRTYRAFLVEKGWLR